MRLLSGRPARLACAGLVVLLVLLVLFLLLSGRIFSHVPLYRRADAPIEQRVGDLLSRMTPEEKARQLDMFLGCDFFDQTRTPTHLTPDAHFLPAKAAAQWGDRGVGAIHDLYPTAAEYNVIQDWIIRHSRLGIPALFIEEGLHGGMDFDETTFPAPIGLGATFDRDLARQTAAAIAAEMRVNGIDMVLAPVLDLARDPRWGRIEEDLGEDPYLTAQLGLAWVEGAQGDSLATDHNIVAEPKHFAGHGSPEGGLNTSSVHVGEREMRMVMLKTFEPAIRQGHAMAVMAAYHDIDGIPVTANSWLLTQVLREEWGFNGFVLSDLGAIRRLFDTHHTAATPEEAVWQALNAGVDMQFYDFDHAVFESAVVDGLRNGKLSSAAVDRAVSAVLRVKFMLGLFDHPDADPARTAQVRRCPAHLDLSLRSARESMCLLKNEGHLLPLSKSLRTIAVIGLNGDRARLGDYADIAEKETAGITLLHGLRNLLPGARVIYDQGGDIGAACARAREADVIIAALGEWHGSGGSGESFDVSSLDLPGAQEKLLEALSALGKPVVLVLQNGRPLSIEWAADHVPAILEAWYPGEFGGRAIAETLFGDNNPAGRLPVTFPRSVGQIPVFYNHGSSDHTTFYSDANSDPLFVFGQGLSYTTFAYDAPVATAPPAGSGGDITVTCHVTNTGLRDGEEVAQLYIRQDTASVVTPVKSLCGFERLHLQAGETRAVTFRVPPTQLAVWNAAGQWLVEPGSFTVTVGGSSAATNTAHFTLP